MIFVTGGTGILGSHLLFNLSKSESAIKALYRSVDRIELTKSIFKFYNPESWETQFSNIKWIEGDILNITELMEHMDGAKHVYHCAALVSFHPKDFNTLIKVNREGTENVVNVCLHHNIEKLCHVSSTAAIGEGDKKTINEETRWKNSPTNSAYGISKYSAEREVWRGIEEGLDAVIVNPCVIFGAGNWNESSLTIFKTVNKGIGYYPPGSNATVDARDVVEIMRLLMSSEISGQRFLCTGTNQSFKDLMSCIAAELKVKKPTKPVSRFTVNVARRVLSFAKRITGSRSDVTKETVDNLFSNKAYDNSKIKNELNFEFRDLQEQVKNAVAGRVNQSKNS